MKELKKLSRYVRDRNTAKNAGPGSQSKGNCMLHRGDALYSAKNALEQVGEFKMCSDFFDFFRNFKIFLDYLEVYFNRIHSVPQLNPSVFKKKTQTHLITTSVH
jgi:hypothetical protein